MKKDPSQITREYLAALSAYFKLPKNRKALKVKRTTVPDEEFNQLTNPANGTN